MLISNQSSTMNSLRSLDWQLFVTGSDPGCGREMTSSRGVHPPKRSKRPSDFPTKASIWRTTALKRHPDCSTKAQIDAESHLHILQIGKKTVETQGVPHPRSLVDSHVDRSQLRDGLERGRSEKTGHSSKTFAGACPTVVPGFVGQPDFRF